MKKELKYETLKIRFNALMKELGSPLDAKNEMVKLINEIEKKQYEEGVNAGVRWSFDGCITRLRKRQNIL